MPDYPGFLGQVEIVLLRVSLILALTFTPYQGPWKNMAGHDINYLALSGVLAMLPGTAEKPSFPLNLLADFAGGGLTCAHGILLALYSRQRSGVGQVVETDMVSGTRYLASFPLLHSLVPNNPMFGNSDMAENGRGTKLLDGGAPFYGVYTCSDGKWVSVGCLEPQFFQEFLNKFIGALPEKLLQGWKHWAPDVTLRTDPTSWPRMRGFIEQGFRARTRDEWTRIFYESDACVVPVLSPEEAAREAHGSIPTPHPVLSEAHPRQLKEFTILNPGQDTIEILRELGYSDDKIRHLVRSGALGRLTAKL